MDGTNAAITRPGTYVPDTIICDFCVLQGVERGDIVEHEQYDRTLPVEALRAKGVRLLYYQPAPARFIELLCPFEGGWLFWAQYDIAWPDGEVTFRCIGRPELSDLEDKSEEILAHPGVMELRALVESYLK